MSQAHGEMKQDVSFGERNELADLFHELLLAWPDATDKHWAGRVTLYRLKHVLHVFV